MARILVVDDDPDVVDAVRLVLERERHAVATAYDREQGLAALTTRTFDLVILDAAMEQPDDGIVLARQLRRKGLTTPILLLASIRRETGRSFGRDPEPMPVDGVVDTPVQPTALIARVDELLAGGKG